MTLGKSGSMFSHYDTYRKLYTNCTHISKNLVLTNIDHGYNLSFLEDIREVYGSVLIAMNDVEKIPLPSLVVIRGTTLYTPPGQQANQQSSFSLFVAGNNGLRELQLNSLQEILSGNVSFKNNKRMCFDDTINWSYILNRQTAEAVFIQDNDNPKEITCNGTASCHELCRFNDDKFCWGAGADMCQMLTGLNCSSACTDRDLRCFGPQENQCCNDECAAGCTGFLDKECLACRNYDNDGKCVSECPAREKQNRRTGLMEPNSDFRYRSSGKCVKKCGYMKYQDDYCVSQCRDEYFELLENSTCVPCKAVKGACQKDIKKCIIN